MRPITAVLALTLLPFSAQAKERTAKPEKVEITALSVSRYSGGAEAFNYRNRALGGPGLNVDFDLTVPDCRVIDLAPDALRVESYKDDSGREMAMGVGITLARGMDIRRFPRRDAPVDEHTISLTLHAGKAPSAGALKIRFKGEGSLVCAAGKTKSLAKELPLEAGATASDGQLTLRVVSVDHGQGVREFPGGVSWTTLVLSPNLPLQQLASLRLLGPNGETLANWVNQRSRDSDGGQAAEITLRVRSDHPKAALAAEYYEKLETVAVPLDIATGIGL